MAVVQIRGVRDAALERLKARAVERGTSLSEYLRVEIELLAAFPTLEEMIERVSAREAVRGQVASEALRRERRQRGVA